jgi:ribonucleoside-diphosphate reductase alpha chain
LPDHAVQSLSGDHPGRVKSPADFEKPCRLAIRFLDELLTYQDYPVLAAEIATMEHRPLGVGIINLAYFLAKNGVGYNDDALPLVDEYAEAWSYYLIKASADLAVEKGACKLSETTKYSRGIVPVDTRKKDIDQLVGHQERMPWAELREQLEATGIRNATVMALMPAETSAQLSNATNGIEPVRALVSEKVSKHGILRQVVPEIGKLKNKYDLLWDQKNPRGYLKVAAVLQKYIDQSISVNTSYNPENYPDNEISMKDMMQDLLLMYKWGIKNAYYFNTYDGAAEGNTDEVIPEGQLEALPEEDCENCKL